MTWWDLRVTQMCCYPLLLLVMDYDLWSTGKVHRATLWASVLLILLQQLQVPIGPTDGTPIDNALATWHSDRTELMNSARPPQDGDFCMGVWKKTGKNTYKLNHFAWFANDTANAPGGIGNPTGPTRFFQQITLSADGNHYNGTFTLDAYDSSGAQVAHIVGVIAATRITVNTTVPDLL